MALLVPGTDSTRLVIEGLSSTDDPDDDYEAVDVTEYIGGGDLASATTVVLSQLKYSTRHPDTPWTVSRLCQPRKRRARGGSVVPARSMLGDLAGIYSRLRRDRSRAELLPKVQISLVSNQPGDPVLMSSVAAASEWVSLHPGKGKAALLAGIGTPHVEVIRCLAEGVGDRLRSAEFCEFLSVLDLSQTGTLGRAALARSTLAGVSELTPDHGPDSARRLFDLVRREALPDSRRVGICAADVLAALGVANLLDLYPAPSRLAPLENPLPSPGARDIAESILEHPGAVVVAHGAAGAGKTTSLRQIQTHLPPGSVVILFDCFGGGEYLSSGEERHTPQRFVTQVVNEIAQSCGTPLLVHPPAMEEDLWRRLRLTLERAVSAMDEDAVLVIAVDAADNAAFAAKERGGRGFVAGLVKLLLPTRASVVLTARSHRVKSLDAPDAPDVPLEPFDATTSAAHMRRYRPDASDADAASFHNRTGGNPRTQYYALRQAAGEEWEMSGLLDACALTPEPLFELLVKSALEVSHADAGGHRWLALLLALARPVDMGALAAALRVSPESVVAFAHGLAPGVQLAGGAIQFRDEDFETYVRGRVDAAEVRIAHDLLADMFLATKACDADAAAHVADHLFKAGRLDEVLQLVLAEDWPAAIPDGFRRAQVQGQRLDLASRAAATSGDAASAIRLAARACDTASRFNTLSLLVESHLDLVARYGDIELLRTHALHQANHRWLAPVHMQLAAALSRDPALHASAREELDSADAWLRRWMDAPEDETRGWNVDPHDVSCAAEARFRLDGAADALKELRRWSPVEFAQEATAELASRVAPNVAPTEVQETLQALGVATAGQAPFLAYCGTSGESPDRQWVNDVLAATLLTKPANAPWCDRLVSVGARCGDRTLAVSLAQHLARPLPSGRWGFERFDSKGTTALRLHALAYALSKTDVKLDELLPSSLKPPKKEEDGKSKGSPHASDDARAHEVREWMEVVEPLLAAATLAARAVIGEADKDEIARFVAAGLASRLGLAQHRWFKFDRSFRAWAAIVADAAVDAGAESEVIDQLVEAAPQLLRDSAPSLWLDLASCLARDSARSGQVADICLRAARHARTNASPASDRLDLLARAAEIAGDAAPAVGRDLFTQAVDVATGINDDAARLLSVHADLACRVEMADLDRPMLAAQLVCAAEAIAPHVTDGDLVPYAAIARAAGRLDAGVALAAVSRWDDEDKVQLSRSLPGAMLGVVDGGATSLVQALTIDNLIEDDWRRLEYQLEVAGRMLSGSAGSSAARLALARASLWVRCHTPARSQPGLAKHLLEWASAHGLDSRIRPELAPVIELAMGVEARRTERWLAPDRPEDEVTHALLSDPAARGWTRLAADVETLRREQIYGGRLRNFVAAVVRSAPADQRLDALKAVAGLSVSVGPETVIRVLSERLRVWRDWPGVSGWAQDALPTLLARFLPDLALRQETVSVIAELRTFAGDDEIRRAILLAIPDARPQLTAFGWQNIASLLGGLCGSLDAGRALVALLADFLSDKDIGKAAAMDAAATEVGPPIPMLLWSTFGHPRRAMRWRAAHAARELLTGSDEPSAAALASALVGCLDRTDTGPYRSPELVFYPLSAAVMLLVTLVRVAHEKPHRVRPQLPALSWHATRKDFPHAQIRELARRCALVVADPEEDMAATLRFSNQPSACLVDRSTTNRMGDRRIAGDRRYAFDEMDTIPYWYTPLARVFGLPADAVAEHAEHWILDEWGFDREDWMKDVRELRDERSWGRMSHRQGTIPPEESLRLYLEYHAMMVAAGELIDEGRPVSVSSWDDGDDSWASWLSRYLPVPDALWLADLRGPVPAERDLFGHVEPLEEWEMPSAADHDLAFGLVDGRLSEEVRVAGSSRLSRPGGYGNTHIWSALVTPQYAADLQRALASASDPMDWKLPDEGDNEFEVNHGRFVLLGWLSEPDQGYEGLNQHDPDASDLRFMLPLPGLRFRQDTGAVLDATGLALRTRDHVVVAHAEQWADRETDDSKEVTSSGYRVHVHRGQLLQYLTQTAKTLIVEVQIGRHRSSSGSDGYRPARSRIYLVNGNGDVTAR